MVAELKIARAILEKMDFEEEYVFYQGHGHVQGQVTQSYTTKIPPSYNGKTSWFAYEDAVLDWIDITELDEVKQGPALKNGLRDEAAVYKPLLDRDKLKEKDTGVKYFLQEMRPRFVKGAQSVFLWRLFQFFYFRRGRGKKHVGLDRTLSGTDKTIKGLMDGHVRTL